METIKPRKTQPNAALFKLFLLFFHSPIIRFLIVGGMGFVTDASVLYALRHEIGLIPAKTVSYCAAFSVTWLLNRCFTFHSNDPRKLQEWLRYAIIYAVTGVLHIGLFAWLTHKYPVFHTHPIGALFIVCVIIAVINYVSSKSFAFKNA